MKIDLSNLLKKEDNQNWSPEGFKAYLKASLIEIIRLELENLPKEDWKRTLQTWRKICAFCKDMMKKGERERFELYQKFGFDQTMIHISESVIEKLQAAYSLGLLKEKDPPDYIIRLGLEDDKEGSEVISFMKEFFKV
ncbi:MAG: hypothetical protein ACK4FY_02090 [Aquificaceae bacterium]